MADPFWTRNMEAFDDSDARLEGMDEKLKAGQAALEASRGGRSATLVVR